MGSIIIPNRHGFFRDEQRALDLVVDKLTHDFDTDEALRGTMPEHHFWAHETPKGWRDIGMPVWHGRLTCALLNFVGDMCNQIANYALPAIADTTKTEEYRKMLDIRDAWHDDTDIQEKVKEYESALQEAYFDFCKKQMGTFLLNVGYSRSLYPDASKKLTELHGIAKGFTPETYHDCDRIYYRVAGCKLNEARKLGEPLKEDYLGSFFILSREEERKMLDTYTRIPKKEKKTT